MTMDIPHVRLRHRNANNTSRSGSDELVLIKKRTPAASIMDCCGRPWYWQWENKDTRWLFKYYVGEHTFQISHYQNQEWTTHAYFSMKPEIRANVVRMAQNEPEQLLTLYVVL